MGKKFNHANKSPKAKASNTSKGQGIISLTSKGVGYVSTHLFDSEDIEIAPEYINQAFHNDEVEIVAEKSKKFKRIQGKVVKIIKRAKTEFVGVLEQEKGKYFVVPDDKKIYTDFVISSENVGKTQVGYKVLVKLGRWDKGTRNPEGEIIKVIGKRGDNDAEMHSIVLERGFPIAFPEQVERSAEEVKTRKSPAAAEEVKKRKDFRQTLTFTIDPADAKDFDDAISFKELGNGKFEIGVHIADVSYYVEENSALDKEALKRGLSIYLVDRTIPMLPEILSNDLCSLNPGEDKMAFSAVFVMDLNGKIYERWFGRTIIHSHVRFTYENAQQTLDDKKKEYSKELTVLNNIALKLRKTKFEKGAIDFEQDEIKFELDSAGRPVRIFKKARLDTHKLVEEYMLLANKEVAEFIYKAHNKKTGILGASLYRIHDVPDREKIADLKIFLHALGYDLPIKKDGSVSSRDLQAILSQSAGKTEEAMIRTAAVRSMAKAIYSTQNVGHFGLAFEYYTHFTSPIRRYADLLIHRILAKHLDGSMIPKQEWGKFEKIASSVTEREIAIADAERASIKYKQVEYMQSRIGQTFNGVISGVTEWGIYIEEVETRSEGMIKLRDLNDDFYILDQKNYALVGEKTKKKFSLGDKVKFKIAGADLDRRTLDYKLI